MLHRAPSRVSGVTGRRRPAGRRPPRRRPLQVTSRAAEPEQQPTESAVSSYFLVPSYFPLFHTETETDAQATTKPSPHLPSVESADNNLPIEFDPAKRILFQVMMPMIKIMLEEDILQKVQTSHMHMISG